MKGLDSLRRGHRDGLLTARSQFFRARALPLLRTPRARFTSWSTAAQLPRTADFVLVRSRLCCYACWRRYSARQASREMPVDLLPLLTADIPPLIPTRPNYLVYVMIVILFCGGLCDQLRLRRPEFHARDLNRACGFGFKLLAG